MKLLIVGGSGFIGSAIDEYFSNIGWSVTIFTRQEELSSDKYTHKLDPAENYDVLINLAGESIGGWFWTKKYRATLVNSRLESTKAVVNYIKSALKPPKAFFNASAIGYYGNKHDLCTEYSPKGVGFLSDLTHSWESAANEAKDQPVRVAQLRFGHVVGAGGLVEKIYRAVRHLPGIYFGFGHQPLSWVDLRDIPPAIEFALKNNMQGPINICTTETETSHSFYKALYKSFGKKIVFTLPGFLCKIVLGKMAQELLLFGQYAQPEKLNEQGFYFKHAILENSMLHAIKKLNSEE